MSRKQLLLVCVVASILWGSSSAYTLKGGLDAINKARMTPSTYSTFIDTNYKAKTVNGVQTDWKLQFNEATPAVFDEAINYLNAATAKTALKLDLGMTYATWKHAKWLSDNNILQHAGEGGSSPGDRLAAYMSTTIFGWGENAILNWISGKAGSEEYMVADYIIDDGVSSRGHRNNIYSTTWTHIGFGIYKGPKSEYFVITFAKDYNCDKCGLIDCTMQKDCGWLDYLAATGQTSPCTNTGSGSGSGTGTGGSSQVAEPVINSPLLSSAGITSPGLDPWPANSNTPPNSLSASQTSASSRSHLILLLGTLSTLTFLSVLAL